MQQPPNMHPSQYQQHPQNHLGMPHPMVSAGPPLQFYPAPMQPITSSANGHSHNHNSHMNMRPNGGQPQFFPMNVNHGGMMGNQPHGGHHQHNGQQLTVVTPVQGHPMNVGMGMNGMGMNGHHMQPMPPPVSHPGGGHMVMSNPGGMHPPGGPGQGQNGGLMSGVNPNQQQMMMGPNGMPQGAMAMMNNRGPVGQPQVD